MFEKFNEIIADITAEANQVRDPENYYSTGKRTYSYRGKEYEFKPIYDGFVPRIRQTVTVDGIVKPREKLTAQQIQFYMRNDFAELLRRYKTENILYRVCQAILFIAALYGVFKMMF